MAEVDYQLISKLVDRFDPEYPAASIAVILTEAWKLATTKVRRMAASS